MLESVLENGHSCSTTLKVSWHPDGVSASHKEGAQASFTSSLLSTVRSELLPLFWERRTKRIGLLLILCMTCYFVLLMWSVSTQSMVLLAYTYTVGFNLLSLLTCVLSVWVERQSPTPLFSFGYERFEVLAVFASTVLAQLASTFIIKESIERLVLEQPEIHTGRLLLGAGIAFVCHIVVIYGCSNLALDHVIAASSSSWLQEHVSDISQSVCSVLPALSGFLLPRVNPMLLIACAGGFALVVTDLLIEVKNCHVVDTLAAISTALMMCATMLPMSIYSGKVLLQTTPSHIVGQLDKCLRETLTIDGVLEFRNEHFWTLSFGKMAGSLQVRVRRDANEQLVLAHVVDRLSNVVAVLTVQVFKDEWTMRRGVGGITPSISIGSTSSPLPPLQNHSSLLSNHMSPAKSAYGSLATSTVNPLPNTMLPNLSYDTSWAKTSNNSSVMGNSTSLPLIPSHMKSTTKSSNDMRYSLSSSSQNLSTIPLAPQSVNYFTKAPSMTNVSFPSTAVNSNDTWYSRRNSALDSTKEVLNQSPQRKNPFLPNFSLPTAASARPDQANNLLISGTRTLDAEKFVYQPR